jgi:hypothetical protein
MEKRTGAYRSISERIGAYRSIFGRLWKAQLLPQKQVYGKDLRFPRARFSCARFMSYRERSAFSKT